MAKIEPQNHELSVKIEQIPLSDGKHNTIVYIFDHLNREFRCVIEGRWLPPLNALRHAMNNTDNWQQQRENESF